MDYTDEQIIELKKEMRRQKHADMKGGGVFINMPEEINLMKFPSVSRPQWIKS